jgi:hypothetical protein
MTTQEIGQKLAETVSEWRDILLKLDISVAREKPSADRWAIAEVIGHLVDSACNNHQRFIRAQTSDTLEFPKYEQNDWVSLGNYIQADWHELVELWWAYNRSLAHLIRSIPETQLPTPCTIGPYEQCTLGFLVVDYLDHLDHHLDKIRERIKDANA